MAASNPKGTSTVDKAREDARKRKAASYAGVRAVRASGDSKSPPQKKQNSLPTNLFSHLSKRRVEELASGSKVIPSSGKCFISVLSGLSRMECSNHGALLFRRRE